MVNRMLRERWRLALTLLEVARRPSLEESIAHLP
jgi:hypothetical protein